MRDIQSPHARPVKAQLLTSKVSFVSRHPYTLLSCAVSTDGCLDDESDDRLILSGPEDLDEVDELRARVDAILVGAGTIRTDNPRLLVRSPARVARRAARGAPPQPRRVTITATGDLDVGARFFAGQGQPPLVYCASSAVAALEGRLGDAAVIIDAGDPLSLRNVLSDLPERAVASVLIEGGSRVLRDALAEDLADELRLAVAPFFVGSAGAPRFGVPAAYPRTAADPMTLASVRRVGSVSVSHYLLGTGDADGRYLRHAIWLSRQCVPAQSAFSAGAVIVSSSGEMLSAGFSGEQQDRDHAEEVALRKLGWPPAGPAPASASASASAPDPRLRGATLYSSLVPCASRVPRTARASHQVSCAQHIIAAGIRRVVFAWREPPLFTRADGAAALRAAGIEVAELPDLAAEAVAVNAHLVPPPFPAS
jgi:riboflavin-specific deaminase-like protein